MAKAKARKFKCSKCDRTFLMAAHLARHKNTTHGAKPKRKVVKTKVAKRVGRKPARRSVKRAQGSQPTPLLLQMQTYRNDLLDQRTQIISQIDAIDKALTLMGAPTRTAGRKPGRKPVRGRRGGTTRAGSLKSYIDKVLRGRTGAMAVKDVSASVLRAGFKSKNKTLAKSVGIALGQMPNVHKVSRGLFRMD